MFNKMNEIFILKKNNLNTIMRALFILILFTLSLNISEAQSQNQKIEIDNRNISWTLHLLASSTPGHRDKVHMIIYGQSISEQGWWLKVKDYILKEYPYADVAIENLAIGGFSSQLLWK
jgi:hypothetical protein